MSKDTKKSEVRWLSSMNTKIIITIIGACTLAVTVCLLFVVPKYKQTLAGYVKDYMFSMATISRDVLNVDESVVDNPSEVYEKYLADVKVNGIDSSYAYLVSADGIMLYHPTAEKIGAPVENEVVSGLVKEIQAGRIPEDAAVSYLYKGKMKYAGYAITDNNEILVVTADEDAIMYPINRITLTGVAGNVIIITFCGLYAAFIAFTMTRPLKKLNAIITTTGNFNFKHNPDSDIMCRRHDETGAMARAIRDMRGRLREIVTNIDTASTKISENVNELQKVSNIVNSMCTDNSATTQELAAGMQESAATTETIHNNVGLIRDGAYDIEKLSEEGAKTSGEVMDRALALRTTTQEASLKTRKMYDSVKSRTDSAIEGSKAVDKINELTDTIMAISSQTSLLALNASIEAARAGEAGRGFAVVATEIGNLADQTSKAIADINSIVGEVNGAVGNMSDCMEETSRFLEQTVLQDYNEFSKVSEKYSEDAQQFETSMNGIHSSITTLSDSIAQIADALEGINATIGESTVGVSEIAEKTTDMVAKTGENYELVNESLVCVQQLSDMVEQFTLE